jgi:hypothetical protein
MALRVSAEVIKLVPHQPFTLPPPPQLFHYYFFFFQLYIILYVYTLIMIPVPCARHLFILLFIHKPMLLKGIHMMDLEITEDSHYFTH